MPEPSAIVSTVAAVFFFYFFFLLFNNYTVRPTQAKHRFAFRKVHAAPCHSALRWKRDNRQTPSELPNTGDVVHEQDLQEWYALTLQVRPWGSVATIKKHGWVNIATIVYLRIVMISFGSAVLSRGIDIQGRCTKYSMRYAMEPLRHPCRRAPESF